MMSSIAEELCKLDYYVMGLISIIIIGYLFSSFCLSVRIVKSLFNQEIPEWIWGLSWFSIIVNALTILPLFLGWLIKLVLC